MARILSRAAIACLLVFTGLAFVALPQPGAFAAEPSPGATNTFDFSPPAPTGLEATPYLDGGWKVSWTAPAEPTGIYQITAYTLRLDGEVIAKVTLLDGNLATQIDLPDDQVAQGGSLTVSATYGIFSESGPSAAVELTKTAVPQEPAATQSPGADDSAVPTGEEGSDPADQPDQPSGIMFGGAVQPPTIGGDVANNPNALETYGYFDGYSNIVSSLDVTNPADMAQAPFHMWASTFWQQSTFLQMSGLLVFSWAVSNQTYAPLTAPVMAALNLISGSGALEVLMLVAVAAWVVWAMWRIGRDNSMIYKTGAYLGVFTAATLIYLATASIAVPQLIQAPVTVTQFTISQVDNLTPTGSTEADYHLSLNPTYDGSNQLEQNMRRHMNSEWLQTGYPAYCQVQFGNMEWATTTYVPNDDDLPAFKDLTFCEYLLKAEVEGNSKALEKLSGSRGKGIWAVRIGGHKGYVEQASPQVWEYYRGAESNKRMFYAGIAVLAQIMLTVMYWGLGLLIIIVVALLTVDAVLLLFWLVAAQYPDLRRKAMDFIRQIGIWTVTPALFLGGVLAAIFVLKLIVALLAPAGWAITTFVQALGTVIIFIYAIMRAIRWMKSDKNKVSDYIRSQFDEEGNGPEGTGSNALSTPALAAPTPIEQPTSGGKMAALAPVVLAVAPEAAPVLAAVSAMDTGKPKT